MDSSKKIELTERNVLLIFKECLDASKQPLNGVNLFYTSAKQKPAVLYIDHKKVFPYYDKIYYMLGQLQEIHQGNRFLTFGKGVFNYNNDRWSNNNASLYALYYLAMTSHCLTGFDMHDGTLTANVFNCIQPTFYPPRE